MSVARWTCQALALTLFEGGVPLVVILRGIFAVSESTRVIYVIHFLSWRQVASRDNLIAR